MANKITTLLDLDGKGWKSGLSDIKKSITDADGAIGKMKAGWKGALDQFKSSPVAVGAAGASIGVMVGKSISAASDLEESINAVNVTFGDSAGKILEFGDNAAKSVGLAKSEFNQLATPLGSILKNAGFQMDDVADKTITLTQRAADMASVFNTDVSDALMAIQAGLRGEQDPLEQYGVSLSAAKVEARALADTGKDTAKSLTDQEKALARVEIILDQTNQVAGDFANTSDGLANSQRVLSAEWENLQAKIGEDLAPALANVVVLMESLIEVSEAVHLDDVFKIPSGAAKLGTLLGTVLSPWNTGARQANQAITDAFNDSRDAAAGFNMKLLDGLGSFEQVRAKVIALGESEDTANRVALEWKRTHDEAVGTLKDLAASTESFAQISSTASVAAMEHKQHVDEVRESIFRQGEITADTTANTVLQARADEDAATAAAIHADAIADLQAKYDHLQKVLSDRSSYLDIEDAFDDVGTAAEDAWNASVEGAEDADQKTRAHEQSVINLKQKVIDYSEAIGNIPPEVASEINTLIDQGSYDAAEAKLAWLERRRQVDLIITPRAPSLNQYGRVVGNARGTSNWRGGVTLVGEEGPELVDLPGGSAIYPADVTQGMMSSPPTASGSAGVGGTYNIYVTANGDVVPDRIVEAIKKFERANGAGWRS